MAKSIGSNGTSNYHCDLLESLLDDKPDLLCLQLSNSKFSHDTSSYIEGIMPTANAWSKLSWQFAVSCKEIPLDASLALHYATYLSDFDFVNAIHRW